ncbi:MAG TPA: YkgJ family cysteine cluster protein, partial [Candidatus Hydrogenedentes bacterium]|nr:YkgJ family cysteine cluster protein [Candidatus Hydrogenedentota bacterium]
MVAQIDCTACANCCLTLDTCVSDEDIARLAEYLAITPESFCEQYVKKNMIGDAVIAETPCPFLDGKRCSVYPHRPKECRDYPNLHKDGFILRLMGVVSNYGECPIVFNVYERLKNELG